MTILTKDSEIPDVPDDVPGDEEEVVIQPSDERLEIPSAYRDGLNMLEHLLSGRNNIYTSEILTIMLQHKIKADDPMFLLLLCIAELELLLVDTPLSLVNYGEELLEELEKLFQEYFGENADINQRFEAANAEYLASVARSAQEIVESVTQRQFYGNVSAIARTVAPAFGVVALAFGLGVFSTLYLNRLSMRTLVGEGKLTIDQYEALKWAESSEGKQARQIMDYNAGYIGKTCREDAQSLGVTLNFGNRKATKGMCVLFVDPPEKRFE